jgi:hypothetical protein
MREKIWNFAYCRSSSNRSHCWWWWGSHLAHPRGCGRQIHENRALAFPRRLHFHLQTLRHRWLCPGSHLDFQGHGTVRHSAWSSSLERLGGTARWHWRRARKRERFEWSEKKKKNNNDFFFLLRKRRKLT